MTPVDFVGFLLHCGGRISNTHAQAALAYFDTLMRRERVVLVKAPDQSLAGFCTFFLLRSRRQVETYYRRAPWTAPADDSRGTVCLIDLIVALRWDKALRQHLEDVILWRFPQIREAVWYRVVDDTHPDRACTYRIRRERLHASTLHR